jgi:diguanylate cyclase (GGDEF)-like protein
LYPNVAEGVPSGHGLANFLPQNNLSGIQPWKSMVHGGKCIVSRAGMWAGEAVEHRVSDDDNNKETSASSQRPLPRAGEVRNEEALMAIDFEGSSEYLLELIVDNLRQLGPAAQGAFLQTLLKGLTSVDVTEEESIVHWEKILAHRNKLTEKLGRPSSLRTAAVDYFGELHLLRKPILLDPEELEKLRHNAATDPLTGLKNRRMFEEYLGREINRSSRYGTSFALLLLDLRRFKIANDTYGHATGDEILRSVARASVETIRGSDISCRIGGDEFAILLPQAERPSAETLAERIARKFETYAKPLAPSTPVGMDYGIAIFPEDAEDATHLFQFADKNLYESKQRAARLPEEPVVTVRASASEVEGRVRESEAATDRGDQRSPAQSASSPGVGLAGERIRPSDYAHDRRKYERIPLQGARGLGVVRLGEMSKIVRLLDLSFGGVCLLMDDYDLPDSFPARLAVPFLPDAELTLHRIYCRQLPHGKRRVGCSFTPQSQPAQA